MPFSRSLHLGCPNKTKPMGRGLVMFFVEMFATRRTKRKVVTPAAVPQIARADAQSQLPLTLGAPAHFSYHRCRPSKSVPSRFTCRRLLVGTTNAVVREVRVKNLRKVQTRSAAILRARRAVAVKTRYGTRVAETERAVGAGRQVAAAPGYQAASRTQARPRKVAKQ
jgi:hypothetical protein